MKQTLTFNVSTIGSTASKINVDAFDESVDAFKNKNYLTSFHHLLDYINPDIRQKHGNADSTSFSVPHGSIVVNINIVNNELKVTAPFLRLPEKNKLSLMRQTAALNFRQLNLPQIELKDDFLQFEYTCPMALVDPYKIYYLLRDICITGDKYDDEFATKFGAERIYEPKITPYDAATIDAVYNIIQESCKECKEGVSHFETERKYGYAWNIVTCTILKVLYYAHPQGQLLNDLNKVVEELDREDVPIAEIVAIGKKTIDRLEGMTKEELAQDLYFVETFISDKRRSSLNNIQENYKNTFEKVSGYIQQEDYMATCVMITYQFYNLYYYNNVQDDINAVVVNAMTNSSGKTWDKAAPILYRAMKDIMEGNLRAGSAPSGGGFKGLMSSLFGNKK